LSELSEIGHFRQDTLPHGIQPELAVTRHYFPDQNAAAVGNGMVGATVHIDEDTGFTSIDGLWMVDDCGRVINPLLVDEQVRGGLIQGVGAALWEECLYDPEGQIINGTLADYLVPMANEIPDISVAHVETPLEGTELGTKGVGEVGTVGGPAAILLAVNDALHAVGAHVDRMPITPEVVLDALSKR
jgi:carbon-monoxide dehydrogenase large subunit